MAAIIKEFAATGKNIFRYWNDPIGCYLYYHRYPYKIQEKEYEVQKALQMMASLIAI
jgi:hypothetical protein